MGTDREGDIMQLTNTTDYAIRIVCYLASENKVITTAELSRELNIPASYIPKITKQLKEKKLLKRQRDRWRLYAGKTTGRNFSYGRY